MEVIKGLDECAGRVSWIICEVSVLHRFKDGYNFGELVALLLKKGFVFYTFFGGDQKATASRLLDCIFLREGDPRFSIKKKFKRL